LLCPKETIRDAACQIRAAVKQPFSCLNLRLIVLDRDEMMRIRLLLAVGAALTLGACETTSPAQQRAADDARCRSYGFRRGSDGFSKCLLDIDLDRAADRRARRDELMLAGPRFYGAPYWRYW
jgi:hypothetical protein